MEPQAAPSPVINNPAEQRFEVTIEGHMAVAEYRLSADRIIFTHTEVPPDLQGRGIANQLAHTALEHARDHHLAVVPLCPFIASYIERHPEYQSLLYRG